MLLEHARFLAQASITAAEKLFDQFEEKVITLEGMPERCPYYDNRMSVPVNIENWLLVSIY